MALVIVCVVLALSSPAGILFVAYYLTNMTRAVLQHLADTQVVGGQPKDLHRLQIQIAHEEKAKHAEYLRQRKPQSPSDIIGN